MKTILLKSSSKKDNTSKSQNIDRNGDNNTKKIREKINNLDISKNSTNESIIKNIDNHASQKQMINKLFLGEDFQEKKFVLSELRAKIASYRQQDIKKDLHEIDNLITLDNVIEKLMSCKLKCY